MKKEIKNIQKDYLSCFSSASGQRVLEDMKKSYNDRSSHADDPYDTAFNEGQRSVYLSILFLMEEIKNPKERQEQGSEEEE
jgi:hypothetical protein